MTAQKRSGWETFWLSMSVLWLVATGWIVLLGASGTDISPTTWIPVVGSGTLAVGSWLKQRHDRRKRETSPPDDMTD